METLVQMLVRALSDLPPRTHLLAAVLLAAGVPVVAALIVALLRTLFGRSS